MDLVNVITLVVCLVGLVLFVPVTVLFAEIVASFIPDRKATVVQPPRPRIAVLVPAHDEALTIGATIASIRSELVGGDRLLVVADNCSDDTAEIARTAGAEVISRVDAMRRGKGFALDFGVRHLAADPPEVVAIVDADCKVGTGSLARICGLAAGTGRPVQAHYDIGPPAGSRSLYLSIATFANRVKNFARPLGCHRLGLPCQLMGTGMAFPWRLIEKANLATSEIVEDLVYGLDLARSGHAPLFCPEATVTSEFPAAAEGQQTQRTRWEAGHLRTIVGRVPGILWDALRRADHALFAMALNAAVPPLAFLALLVSTFTLLALLIAMIAGLFDPLQCALIIGVLFSIAVLLAWWRVGRDVVSLYELALSPGYALSKLGIYRRVLAGRRFEWIRSKRDTH